MTRYLVTVLVGRADWHAELLDVSAIDGMPVDDLTELVPSDVGRRGRDGLRNLGRRARRPRRRCGRRPRGRARRSAHAMMGVRVRGPINIFSEKIKRGVGVAA